MNRQITKLFVVIVLLFGVLVYFTSRWTVFSSDGAQQQPAEREAADRAVEDQARQDPRRRRQGAGQVGHGRAPAPIGGSTQTADLFASRSATRAHQRATRPDWRISLSTWLRGSPSSISDLFGTDSDLDSGRRRRPDDARSRGPAGGAHGARRPDRLGRRAEPADRRRCSRCTPTRATTTTTRTRNIARSRLSGQPRGLEQLSARLDVQGGDRIRPRSRPASTRRTRSSTATRRRSSRACRWPTTATRASATSR